LTGNFNKKIYSVDNFDTLKDEDFKKIKKALGEGRTRIVRFLAQGSKEEKDAKSYEEIADHISRIYKIHYAYAAARKGCIMLRRIGLLYQTRSRKNEMGASEIELIKFYLVTENLIEILAILSAADLGLNKEAAIKIKEAITKIFNESQDKFRYGIYGGKVLDMQTQLLDVIRNIAHDYTQLQKDLINRWYEVVAEFNSRHYYYYPWFYPIGFANMVSKVYRSIADYAISGLNIAQNNFDAYIDMSKTYSGFVADNINEMSRIVLNSPKIFEPMPQASISIAGPETTNVRTQVNLKDDEEYDLSELRKLISELTEILEIALSST
jgi:hypothetical protein